MTTKISVDRFTRTAQVIAGQCTAASLSRLKPFLALPEGEIDYTLSGAESVDASGGRVKRVKCIITGWFFLLDPKTLEPEHHDLAIESRLVVVNEESELPPLEDEAADEDYVALGAEFEVEALIEEEILLDLPLWAITAKPDKASVARGEGRKQNGVDGAPAKKPSPFAKLATLKKSMENKQ